jgi:hypothetical protein
MCECNWCELTHAIMLVVCESECRAIEASSELCGNLLHQHLLGCGTCSPAIHLAQLPEYHVKPHDIRVMMRRNGVKSV